MKFKPLSEQEMQQARNNLSPGPAQFEVLAAEEQRSKSGNDMIKLQLKVWDKNGNQGIVYDYLMAISQMQWKLKHFCEATEKDHLFTGGLIKAEDCLGQAGECQLQLQKDKAGEYGDQIKVKDYGNESFPKAKGEAEGPQAEAEQDVPF